MKIAISACLILWISMSCTMAIAQQQRNTTVATYYPAPRADYATLLLIPSSENQIVKRPGNIYFDKDFDTLRICNNAGNWTNFTGGGSLYWAQNQTTHSIYNMNTGGTVGYNTTSPNPLYKLQVVNADNDTTGDKWPLFLEGDGGISLEMSSASDTQQYGPELVTHRASGSLANPLPIQSGDASLFIEPEGRCTSKWSNHPCFGMWATMNANGLSSPGEIMFCFNNNGTNVCRVLITDNGFVSLRENADTGALPRQILDVDGSIRLEPQTIQPANVTGSIYYNNTTNTLVYRDNSTWNNFISEYGSVMVYYTESVKNVTFRKKYATPPIVIPTIYRLANCTTRWVHVFVANVTNTTVRFDIDAYNGPDDGSAHGIFDLDNATSGSTVVNYFVIPR